MTKDSKTNSIDEDESTLSGISVKVSARDFSNLSKQSPLQQSSSEPKIDEIPIESHSSEFDISRSKMESRTDSSEQIQQEGNEAEEILDSNLIKTIQKKFDEKKLTVKTIKKQSDEESLSRKFIMKKKKSFQKIMEKSDSIKKSTKRIKSQSKVLRIKTRTSVNKAQPTVPKPQIKKSKYQTFKQIEKSKKSYQRPKISTVIASNQYQSEPEKSSRKKNTIQKKNMNKFTRSLPKPSIKMHKMATDKISPVYAINNQNKYPTELMTKNKNFQIKMKKTQLNSPMTHSLTKTGRSPSKTESIEKMASNMSVETKTDMEAAKMMEKLFNLYSCFENLMNKIQKTNEENSQKEQIKINDPNEGNKTDVNDAKTVPNEIEEKPLTDDDMEDLNDALTDLNTAINTLKDSYGSIIRSLMTMQNRRAKKVTAMNMPPIDFKYEAPPVTDRIITIQEVADRAKTINYNEKYNMDLFLDQQKRDEAFQNLFNEVVEINAAFKRFCTFFDNEGYFQANRYKESDFRITRKQHEDCIKVIKDMNKSVGEILKAYNTDLLDMFRLKSTC